MIRALNEPEVANTTSDESSDDEGKQQQQSLSKEALQEQCLEKYRKALIAIQENKEGEAKDSLEDLISELKDLETDNDTLDQLRFSVFRNLGNLKKDDIEDFVEALQIDPTDISLWIKTGDRGAMQNNFAFARFCYEYALNLNPQNWVAIDRLMDIYYIMHLPFELYDICSRALSLTQKHAKAEELLAAAIRLQPTLKATNELAQDNSATSPSNGSEIGGIVKKLESAKRKRREQVMIDYQKFKKTRLSITLDTARTQSLASFGNYVMRIYERFSKQSITRHTMINITLNNTLSFSQQFNINGSTNSQSLNQNSNDANSQDVEMSIEGEGTSRSDNDKSNQRNEPTTSNDENDQTKSSARNRSNQNSQKSSSLSFATMLFPLESGDKRRSSRNRTNQDDSFSFKMKFDELNELLPEKLRIGAIEEALQKRREEQQRHLDLKAKEQEESVSQETNLDPVREDLIIKDIVEAITNRLQTPGSFKSDIKLCDMFHLYLSKLSQKKQNSLPEVYPKIYKVYRKLCPLPNGVFVEINPDGITLDELWFTLTANEICYNHKECMFLLRFLAQLEIYLDEAQHKEFRVRLFLVLGSNSDHRYLDIALKNIEEDTRIYASNRKIITRAYLKTLIDKTNEKLSQDNDDSENYLELINKLAPKSETEMSDREIGSLCAAINAIELWQRGLDILNQRNDLNNDVIIDTLNICLRNGAKMDAILASKLCKEALSGTRPATWSCLYYGWVNELSEAELADEDMIERLDKFFELGHQTLGKKCTCTIDRGEFLMLYVKHLLQDYRDSFEERDLLGAMSCLFDYPTKKPVAVSGHKAQRVKMQWKYAEIIYDYFEPEQLPTYTSQLRKKGITSELETLFKEIAAVIPDSLNPAKPGGAIEPIKDFIEKGTTLETRSLPENKVTKNLFYFLADYYFKNKSFDTAKSYYYSDLAINPERFDSWAASGLLLASGVDKALSEGNISTEDFVEGTFCDLTDSAIRCFQEATKLKPNETNATLWIEFGNLTYNLVSLCSRLFAYDEFELDLMAKQPTKTDKLEMRHKYLYQLTKNCFKSALSLCQCEEIWLQYYMLGKIYEKVEPFRALEYYYMADAQLWHEGANYPKKISYHNPPDLAFEAMEVHYRIHCTSLKYLLTNNEITQEGMNHLKRILLNAQRSPFVELEGVASPKKQMEKFISRDVSLLLDDVIDFVEKEAEFDELIFMCLHGMRRCLVRSDKNFKALYRLSFYYRKIRDSQMAQEILWAGSIKTDRRIANLLARKPGIPEFRAAPPDLSGIESLFSDRKIGNIFYNVWRLPIEEIDRPGCFEHWMFKCTWLLIKICVDLNDTNVLNVIAFQLSRAPETAKKYMPDRPRILMGLCATKAIVKIVSDAIERADGIERKQVLIREGLLLADKFIKANVFVDHMQGMYKQLTAQARLLAGQVL